MSNINPVSEFFFRPLEVVVNNFTPGMALYLAFLMLYTLILTLVAIFTPILFLNLIPALAILGVVGSIAAVVIASTAIGVAFLGVEIALRALAVIISAPFILGYELFSRIPTPKAAPHFNNTPPRRPGGSFAPL